MAKAVETAERAETKTSTIETPAHLPLQQVDPDTAELFISEKKIGERIKKLRLKKSMGLVELGRHTGLSASFLSQLETGRVVPTLRNLARIAMVFSKDLSYFFEPEAHTLFRLHRKSDRLRLPQTGTDDPTYFFESLGYLVPDRGVDPYLAEFIPLKKPTEVKTHQHPGHEFLYVSQGCLELQHGETRSVLAAGDAVYFDASTPHSYRCSGSEKCCALIVTVQAQTYNGSNSRTTVPQRTPAPAGAANGSGATPGLRPAATGTAGPAPFGRVVR